MIGPIETIHVNDSQVELYPIYAYDVLTNLGLFHKIQEGLATEQDMDRYLKLVFSNCTYTNTQGHILKFVNPGSFREIWGAASGELQTTINTILSHSMPDASAK